MKYKILALLLLPLACHRPKENAPLLAPTTPGMVLGLQGPTAASVEWILPVYLQGRFEDTGQPFVEASFEWELTRGAEKRKAHIHSGFSVKPCDPAAAITSFLSTLGREPADSLPETMKIDIEVLDGWRGNSQDFAGKILLKKTYKSGDETGIYRFDAVFANEKSKACLFWNLVITPARGVSADFVESSTEYQQLIDSLAATWKGIGVDLDPIGQPLLY